MSENKQKNSSNSEFENVMNQMGDHARNLIAAGNVRRVIVSKENGDTVANLTLTTVAGGALVMLFILPQFLFLLAVVGIGLGIYKRASVRIVHEVKDDFSNLEDKDKREPISIVEEDTEDSQATMV